MSERFYIDMGGTKDGPHDLITLMRRIRTRKILPHTPIYRDDDDATALAGEIPDLIPFFQALASEIPETEKRSISVVQVLQHGWNFTMEHSVMTVYAGAMLLLVSIAGFVLVKSLGLYIGSILTWVLFMMLHSLYMVFALRRYRGQVSGSDFIQRHVSPILPTLMIASVITALSVLLGSIALIVPGILLLVCFIFAPFLILDFQYQGARSLLMSIKHSKKRGLAYIGALSILVILHVFCLALILPSPVTIPVFAAALAELYEIS